MVCWNDEVEYGEVGLRLWYSDGLEAAFLALWGAEAPFK